MPQALIEESAASGRDITVEYTGQDGEAARGAAARLCAHDAGLWAARSCGWRSWAERRICT